MRYIVLKEFYKFRFAFWVFVVMACFCCAWNFFEIQKGFEKIGAIMYALQIMFNKNFTYNHLDEINIAFGAIIGLCSMFFERHSARIRVQFHFPHTYLKNIVTITLIQIVFLLGVYAVEILTMFGIFSAFFPAEIVTALLSTLIYSCAFGVAMFWLAQSTLIEPHIRRVVASIVAAVAMAFIYFKINPDISRSSLYYLNDKFWPYMAICWAFCLASLVAALQNYKKGYIK